MSRSAVYAVEEGYPWHWLAVLLIAVGTVGYLLFGAPAVPRHPAPDARSAAAETFDTYLVIHMPAVPHKNREAARRAEDWLSDMSMRGYNPMRLSDVHRRLSTGQRLPPRTVVLMFDPGYRRTFDVLAPVLARYRFPAVWVTDASAAENRDWRYVSGRVIRGMQESGQWDVARYERTSRLVVDRPGEPPLRIEKDGRAWVAGGGGRRALNRGAPEGGLERLHVNWNWTGQDLVDRLHAEEPLDGAGALTFKRIHEHKWGVIVPPEEAGAAFSLRAPSDGRTDNLSWLGMKFTQDALLDLEVERLNGELWVLLRSDEKIGEQVGVCFANGRLAVTLQENHLNREVAAVHAAALRQPTGFSASIRIEGRSLEVAVNGETLAEIGDLPVPESQEGIVRMKIYDKVLGAARAEVTRFKAEAISPAAEGAGR